MKRILNMVRRTARQEEGITGLETAIILIAFVVVATVFGSSQRWSRSRWLRSATTRSSGRS